LALCTESPNERLLDEKPHDKNESVISGPMINAIAWQVVYQITALSFIIFAFPVWLGLDTKELHEKWTYQNGVHGTLVFNALVFMEMFNLFNCRRLEYHGILFDSKK